MRSRLTRAARVTTLLVAQGCLHFRSPVADFEVSSLGSDYSPALRLTIDQGSLADPGSDSALHVVISRGTVVVPGTVREDTMPIMRDLYLTVFIATRPRQVSTAPMAPWDAASASDSIPLAEAMGLGERRALAPLRLRVPWPAGLRRQDAWLVFQVTGSARTTPTRLASGVVLPTRIIPGGVRVYACAAWNLNGRMDRRRSRQLATSYLSAC